MYSPSNAANARKRIDALLAQAQQCIVRGAYAEAEAKCKQALDDWRRSSGARSQESKMVSLLGKCYEAQHKYEAAYELYMEALPNLQGQAYDDIYTSLLYLNERMGTFRKKNDEGTSI